MLRGLAGVGVEPGRWCGWFEACSTLLGPERTTLGRRCRSGAGRGPVSWMWWKPAGVWLLFQPGMTVGAHRSSSGGAGAVGMVVGWSLVENCTVDASILFSVVKLSRANGGCLGTRSR